MHTHTLSRTLSRLHTHTHTHTHTCNRTTSLGGCAPARLRSWRLLLQRLQRDIPSSTLMRTLLFWRESETSIWGPLYMWHVILVCATWLIHLGYTCSTLMRTVQIFRQESEISISSFLRMCRDSCIRDMTHSYVWHDLVIRDLTR